MNTAAYVKNLISQLKTEEISISDKVWKTALACIGFPYCFGAWGEECTPSNRRRRTKADNSKCQVINGSKGSCNGCKWYPDGNRVLMFDCRGFTGWILGNYGINISKTGATSQWNGDYWDAKGEISTVPDNILVCLFVYDKEKDNMAHTGFGYHGQTCECSVGVQHFEKRKSKWTHWAIPRGINGYDPDYRPTLKRGDKGEYVALLQTQLVNRGYNVGKTGIDGDFGKMTEAAVKQFQKDNGLTVDGIAGKQVWDTIDQSSPTLFTVTIPHLRETQADKLVSEYVGATKVEERG